MKKITRTFHPNEINTMRFSIGYLSTKARKAMGKKERVQAIEFLIECEKDLRLFKRELMRPLKSKHLNP